MILKLDVLWYFTWKTEKVLSFYYKNFYPRNYNKIFFPYPHQLYWDITDIQHGINLKWTKWWFDIFMHCEMITTIKLVHLSITSCSYLVCVCVCVCVVRTFKIHPLSNFQANNTLVLTVITMLYIRTSELFHLLIACLYTLANISPFPPAASP